jgi:hypothetical protein
VIVDVFLDLCVFMHPFEVQHDEDNCDGDGSDDSTNNLANHYTHHVIGVIHEHLNNHQQLISPAQAVNDDWDYIEMCNGTFFAQA